MDNKLQTLILDIETSPILAYVWGVKDQYIGNEQIKEDWKILAWGAKWLGEPPSKIIYSDLRKNPSGGDKLLLRRLWKLLDQAHIVITQNGVNFDGKRINARFMLNGMKPPSPYKHLDTYQLVKRVAGFTSNKLSYLTEKFCNQHKKTDHGKYPGWKLWIECLKGNKNAWNEIKRYNIKDVLSTEEFYLKIKAWAPEHFPKPYPVTDYSKTCGTCGYYGKLREGTLKKAKKYFYKQHRCTKCGAWQTGEKIK